MRPATLAEGWDSSGFGPISTEGCSGCAYLWVWFSCYPLLHSPWSSNCCLCYRDFLPAFLLKYWLIAASWVTRSSVNWMQNIPTLALWWAEWWPKGSRTLQGFSAVRLQMPTYATKQLFWMWMCSCGALHVLSVLCGPHSGVCKTLQLGSACVLRSLGVALGPAGEAVCTDFLFCARGEVLSWGGVLDDWGAVCRLAPECKVLPEDGRRAGGGKRLWLVLRFRLDKAAG